MSLKRGEGLTPTPQRSPNFNLDFLKKHWGVSIFYNIIQDLGQQIREWVGVGVMTCADLAGTGGGVQNFGKPADVILECSLQTLVLHVLHFLFPELCSQMPPS